MIIIRATYSHDRSKGYVFITRAAYAPPRAPPAVAQRCMEALPELVPFVAATAERKVAIRVSIDDMTAHNSKNVLP